MHPLLLRLAEGPPNAIGPARSVAAEAAGDPTAVAVLMDGLVSPDEGVRNRSAWVLNRVARSYPSRLAPHAGALLEAAEAGRFGGMLRRLLPRLLARVPLDDGQAGRVMVWGLARLDRSPIAEQANVLEALASVALQHPGLAPRIVPRIHLALDHPAPAVRARGRHLCARLDRHGP